MTDPITRLNSALEGRYRVEREIGAGGMAIVYLAEDLRHHRKVALKVLKPELAAVVGGERFLSEIETTAQLTHPHILPLHDSGEADGFLFFVMPYIEGDTLRDKIDRDKQLGVQEALEITKKVASALDYAHEHGVVHRDIKPANILLSERGEPTVSDFGIALAVAHAGAGRVTETGLSVGTPHYMSPEQATGDRDVDPRADIYALGCVLYEMLTGDPPYQGSTAQAVLAKILTDPAPAPNRTRLSIPANVDAAIRKALEKLPADRFASAEEFAKALSDPSFRYGEEEAAMVGGRQPTARPLAIGVGVAVGLVAGVAGALLWSGSRGGEGPAEIVKFAVALPDSVPLEPLGSGNDLAISADGRLIVYQTGGGDQDLRFRVRWLDQLETAPLRGTEGGAGPFVSPDGEWVGFMNSSGGSPLRKVSVFGGPPVTIVSQGFIQGASWGDDHRIIFGTQDGGLFRVSDGGGEPEQLTTPDPAQGEEEHIWPSIIPGRDAVLFTVNGAASPALTGGQLAVLDLQTMEVTRLGLAGVSPRYVPTGHVVFAAADGTVRAVPFDLQSLETTGSPVPLLEGVAVKSSGAANFDVSRNGRLVYVGGAAGAAAERTLVWVDRGGREEPLAAPARGYVYPRLSPDGERVALDLREEESGIWIWDLRAETLTRLVLPQSGAYPTWAPDGDRIAYTDGSEDIHWKAANNTGSPEVVAEAVVDAASSSPSPYFFTPDGSALVVRDQGNPETDDDLLMVAVEDSAPPQWRLAGDFRERNAELSPDGRWMAYQSDESGQFEVYVRPFPDVEADQVLISNNGGAFPLWSPNGQELFYVEYGIPPRLISVSFEVGGGGGRFEVIGRRAAMQWPYYTAAEGRTYDVSPDGQRFLAIKEGTGGEDQPALDITVVQNWFEEVRERMGAQ